MSSNPSHVISDAIGPIRPTNDIELANIPTGNKGDLTKSNDPFRVSFHPDFDVDNPKDWPSGRKWAVTDVMSATGFNRIMVSTIMAPALTAIAHELHMSSAEANMSLSIYQLATAFGPLVIGPLSEVYGRSKVLHASNVWFLVWNIVCGFASSKEVLIAARFLAGFGASSIFALAGGVLTDIWRPEQRGRSLGIYLIIPLLGAAVGPIIGGFMAFRTTWRWMFWATSIFQAVMILVSFTTFRETYAPTILSRRAARLRKDTGDARYHTLDDQAMKDKSITSILVRAISRPMRLLAFHPIIQISSVISAFYYGILYIVLTSFAELWTKRYNLSVEISGLHYIAVALGEVGASQICAPLMDRYYRHRRAQQSNADVPPEHRIPLTIPGAVLAPLALFLYGWTAQYKLHWLVIDLGVCLTCFFMQAQGMPMQAYVMDAYVDHTSSAMAASQLLRSLAAFSFPLFAPTLYEQLGYGWANSTLAFTGLALGLPASATLWYLGPKLRQRMPSSH